MFSHLQNPVSEWKFQTYSYAAPKGKSKTRKDHFVLTNLFFKTRFCKDQWESTEVIWPATPGTAGRERQGSAGAHRAKDRTQNHPAPQTHSHSNTPMLLQGLYVSQQNKAVKTMFLLIWQADPQHWQTATPASYMKNVAPNLPEG